MLVNESDSCTIVARRDDPRGRRDSVQVESRSKVPHLLDCWQDVVLTIRRAKHLAVFVDLDGTLVPLRSRPSDVEPLNPPMRRVLRRLTKRKWIAVYVISGRRLSELRRLVRVRGIHLLGLHGWEGRVVSSLNDGRRAVRRAKRLLDRDLPMDGQVWVEDKGLGLAVHYREADSSAVRRARSAVRNALSIFGSRLHVMQGHKVWELLPHEIDGKGAAACAVLATMPVGTLPIFAGDDTTDESAFTALRDGLTIRVGNKVQTQARFILRDPEEVRVFLLKLEAELV